MMKLAPHNHFVTGPQAENVLSAVSYLNAAHGLALDTHIVIAHECVGIKDHEAAARLVWLLFHRLRKWFHRRQMEAFYIYIHENSRERGFHTHVLLHADEAGVDLRKWLPGAVERLWGGPLPGNMLHIKNRRQRKLSHRIALQSIWLRYVLKGVWPGLGIVDVEKGMVKPVHEVLGLRPRPGGLVLCRKRVGVSSNIGRRARDKAGYASLFSRGVDDRLFAGDEFRMHEEALRQAEAAQLASQLVVSLSNI